MHEFRRSIEIHGDGICLCEGYIKQRCGGSKEDFCSWDRIAVRTLWYEGRSGMKEKLERVWDELWSVGVWIDAMRGH